MQILKVLGQEKQLKVNCFKSHLGVLWFLNCRRNFSYMLSFGFSLQFRQLLGRKKPTFGTTLLVRQPCI